MDTVFHLAFEDEWNEAQETGSYVWSTRDMTIEDVGFLHASYASQTLGVAQRFYSDVDAPLVLLELDTDELERRGFTVREEPGLPDDPTSERFPHVYGGDLPVEAVASTKPYVVPGS